MSDVKDPIPALDAFMKEFSFSAEDGLVVRNLPNHEVHRRADRNTWAAYFAFEGLRSLETHVSEIAPGQATQAHRHCCEAVFYVLTGRGRTEIWREGGPERQIEWEAGDLFVTPILHWHRPVHTDSWLGARYLEITTIPLMKALGAWSMEVSTEMVNK